MLFVLVESQILPAEVAANLKVSMSSAQMTHELLVTNKREKYCFFFRYLVCYSNGE
jgi:hypothetical protein